MEKFIVNLVELNRERPHPKGGTYRLDRTARRIAILEDYQNHLGICNHEDPNDTNFNVFGVSGFYPGEDFLKGGLRERLYHDFAYYGVGERFNIDVLTWMRQEPHNAEMQLDIAKAIFEAENKVNKKLSDEQAKLNQEHDKLNK